MLHRRTTLGLLLVGASGVAHAQRPRVERLDLMEAGPFTAKLTGQPPAPGTPTGRSDTLADVVFDTAAARVPGKLGVQFGIRFSVVGAPANTAVSLREVWRLPPPGARDLAKNQTYLETSYEFPARIGESVVRGYGFDNAWEIVPGEWTIEIREGARNMLTRYFTVSAP